MNKIVRWNFAVGAALLLAVQVAAGTALPGNGRIRVVTTLSVLQSIAGEIGGERVWVESLADPQQDPHYVQPRPTLMKKAREADLFIEIGLQLELWTENVISGAGNVRIQKGQPGHLIASTNVPTLELPQSLSREWGDIHPYGNPHIWLDPINAKQIAENIAAGLRQLDPQNAAYYDRQLAAFNARIDAALFGEILVQEVGAAKLTRLARQGKLMEFLQARGLAGKLGGWLKQAQPLRGQNVISYHKTWAYFAERFGFKVPVEIEEKPGIEPSARHRDRVVELGRNLGVRKILMENFYKRTAADYIAEQIGARVTVVPIDVGGTEGVRNYFQLIDFLLQSLLS